MPTSTRPLLILYVAWHPDFTEGRAIAKHLYDQYRRELFQNVAGGAGLSVIYRSASDVGADAPPRIDLEEGETTAIVLLLDEKFCANAGYVSWAREVGAQVEEAGLGSRVFPVAVDKSFYDVGFTEQAVRWDKWIGSSPEARLLLLTSDLTYQFCRMLRTYLERLRRPKVADNGLQQYLKKVQIFLSHSKHDSDGERIAKEIRSQLFNGNGLASFFDVKDIPSGVRFDQALMQEVKLSAVVAIHTDSFSSREWCRREIIEAKRWSVPLVVANCLTDTDERSFPYLGNVPVVRMDPVKVDRVDQVVARLLVEVLKDFLWRCRVELASGPKARGVEFLPRPPELIALANLSGRKGKQTLVYPDPPLGAEEQRLFEQIAPRFLLRSLTEWLASVAVTR
ncbi:MAG: toll/interleukin-1 receptor domain-containing protein [Burkholderiales bacterium]|nr:toll/interleukin-1 receptor domain-containing protein [Burkholderiales bacterium]